MIPRILDNNKTLTQLATDSTQGLGKLTDCLSCKVKEKRNGEFTATMTVPVDGQHFTDLTLGGIIAMQSEPNGSEQWFRIQKISKPLNGQVTIELNHISYDLGKTSVSPLSAVGAPASLVYIKSHMTGGDAFTLYTDISNTESAFSNDRPQSARALFGGQSGSLLDVFGGEYEWDNLTVKLLASRGLNNGVRIAYGKNLTDIRQDENIENMYTAVMPYTKRQDEAAVLGTMITMVQSLEPKILNLDLTEYFDTDEEITVAKIDQKAQAYIDANDLTHPRINLKVSFVNLADTEEYKNIAPLERVRLCDTVTVAFPKLGVDATAKVIETDYDVLKERYESIEIGDAKSSLSTRINKIAQEVQEKVSQTFLEKAIDAATDLITGGMGGHVVISTNAAGEPNEILVMDTDDKATATNVIRINMNGIGFSNNGYSGPYTTAWTIDGGFNADFINSGTIQAINIIGSLIQGSSLIFGDAPNTTELRTNDAKTGALFNGSGVMEFTTVGRFNAVNKSSTSGYDGSTIRMANDSNNSGRNYLNLMNYRPDKVDDGYYTSLANSIYVTANNTATAGNTMRLQNYSWDSASYTANQVFLQSTSTSNYLHLYNYDRVGLIGNEINEYVGNTMVGTDTYEGRSISVNNNTESALRANYFFMTCIPATSYTNIEMSNYDLTNSTSSSRVYGNNMIMRSQTTSKTIGFYNRKLADGNYANYFQMTGSSSSNTFTVRNYKFETNDYANLFDASSNATHHSIGMTNYAVSTTSIANGINLSNDSSANNSVIEIYNRDKNGNSLRNQLYMVDNASTQYIRLANYAGSTIRNSLYGVLTGNNSEIGLHVNNSSGSEVAQITCSSDGKLYVKANGYGAWGCGWIQVNGVWVLGYVA